METTPQGRGRPATGQTPKRYFRMSDDDWQQIESAASVADKSTSDYIRRVLLKDAAKTNKQKNS